MSSTPKSNAPAHERVVTLTGQPPFGIRLHAQKNDAGEVIGCVVENITPGSPAERAGFQCKDFISSIGGKSVLRTPLDRVTEILRTAATPVKVTVQGDTWLSMQSGAHFVKVRSKKLCPRQFFLSSDFRKLRWLSRRKEPRDAYIYTQEIKAVIKGRGPSFQAIYATSMPKIQEEMPENCCLTIIYGENSEELNLVAHDEEARDLWVNGLQYFCKTDKPSALQSALQHAASVRDTMVDLFEYGANHEKTMSESQCRKLLHHLNCNIQVKDFKDLFNRACNSDGKKLNQKEFVTFFRYLHARRDLEELLEKFGTKDSTNNVLFIEAPQLLKFLSTEQKRTELTLARCGELISSLEPELPLKSQSRMGLEGFTRLLQGPDGDVINPVHLSTDMTQPLAHYFVASSHNTYLTDHQLYGTSDVMQYQRVLRAGCKCVELDCWDGDDGEPIIYHGHTLTTKISFEEVIKVIGEYGFAVSPYPVILSLEVHTSIDQQQKMAKYLVKHLGPRIVTDVHPDRKDAPSPEELKYKFLIKGKKLPSQPLANVAAAVAAEEGEVSDEDEAAEVMGDASVLAGQSADLQKKLKRRATKNTAPAAGAADAAGAAPKEKVKKIKLARELSDLVSWVRGAHFHHWNTDLDYSGERPDHIVSFSEGQAEAHFKENAAAFVARNKKQLTRTYPAGFRVNSSNYDPVEMWNAGAQLVALNYQTPSTELSVYRGRFRDNMEAGYILKPKFLCDPKSHFNPYDPSTFRGIEAMNLKLTIIGANNLPKPEGARTGEIIDPYVIVKILGVPADEKTVTTDTVIDNGFNPRWNADFSFTINVPELAIVLLQVYDKDDMSKDDFIGHCVVPFKSLMPGYRHFPLRFRDEKEIKHAAVFGKITITPKGKPVRPSSLTTTVI